MEAWREELYRDELYHHGVIGMKWGVRRYQNPDGTLTAAGRRRYDVGNKSESSPKKAKVSTQDAYAEKFKELGYSDEEAQKAARNKAIAQKILIGASAVALTAAAVYVAKRHLPSVVDGVIKSGETLQRIEMQSGGKLYDKFYAARGKADKAKYAGLHGKTRQAQVGAAYKMGIGVNKDIKIAADRNARKVFMDLYNKDSSFRNEMQQYAKSNVQGLNFARGNSKKMYDNFNSYLVALHDNKEAQKFYDALAAKGYGAIRDANDRKFSGYNAQNPLIIFNRGVVSVDSFKKMSASEINKSLNKAAVNELLESNTKLTAGVLVSSTLASLMDSASAKNEYREKHRSKNRK